MMTEGSTKPGEEEKSYNPMYERFVDDAHDSQKIVGIIAYGLYKSSKRDWACKFREKNGRGPNPDDLSAYVMTWTDDSIQGQMTRAAQILTEFANGIEEQAKPRILEEALRGKFWDDIWRSILANVVYTILLIAVALVLKFSGVDFLGIFDTVSREPPAANSPSTGG